MNLRYLWRSLLCVYVLFFVLFSPLCYASQTEVIIDDSEEELTANSSMLYSFDNDEILAGYLSAQFNARIRTSAGTALARTLISSTTYTPPFNLSSNRSLSTSDYNFYTQEKEGYQCYVTFKSPSEFTILDKDKSFNIDLSGLSFGLENQYNYTVPSVVFGTRTVSDYVDSSNFTKAVLTLYDSVGLDGSYKEYNITDSVSFNGNTFGVSLKDVNTTFDVKAFRLWFTFNADSFSFDESSLDNFDGWTGYAALLASYTDSMFTIHENDNNTGLLNGIIDWLRNIRDGITSVGQGVTNVVTGITQLPSKMQDMLVGFFVPDEDTINSKYAEFETLLSDRFGLIYQSSDIIHDFAESFQTQAVMTADTGGIITMPQVTVSLAGTPFTFGGYEVDIIPDGFETLQQMCRLAVSMVCTVVFVNMLKSKLEWILR